MPRKNSNNLATGPFHVSARCINREWFEIPLPEVWRVMENYLFFISHAFSIKIHSFVLMANHYHLLISAPESNLSPAMNYFNRETSREIGRIAGRINQVYGGRFFRSLISEINYFYNVYKYVYRNPVRAGNCKRAEEYEFSTLRGILGFQKLIIPIELDTLMFNPYFDPTNLDWINKEPAAEAEQDIRNALRRTTFQPRRNKHTGEANPLIYIKY